MTPPPSVLPGSHEVLGAVAETVLLAVLILPL
jgi:hypothetical protein